MADTHVHEAKPDDVVLKAKNFWTQYQKPLLTIIMVVVALIGGWFAYKNYIVAPKEDRSAKRNVESRTIFPRRFFKSCIERR